MAATDAPTFMGGATHTLYIWANPYHLFLPHLRNICLPLRCRTLSTNCWGLQLELVLLSSVLSRVFGLGGKLRGSLALSKVGGSRGIPGKFLILHCQSCNLAQSNDSCYFEIGRKIKVLWPNFEGPDADEVKETTLLQAYKLH